MISPLKCLPELVIFDCDGVLVDTEPLANRILQKAIATLGIDMPLDEVVKRFVGRSMARIIKDISALSGRPVPDHWVDKIRQDTITAFKREGIKAIPHIREAVLAVQGAGIAICVASSGIPRKMDLTLGVTGLKPLFDGRIYSSILVENGKPAPDLFLYAARQFGIRPAACVVVEDSKPGVQAARAAGMRCLGFATRGQGDVLSDEGAEVFSDMRELAPLIGIETS